MTPDEREARQALRRQAETLAAKDLLEWLFERRADHWEAVLLMGGEPAAPSAPAEDAPTGEDLEKHNQRALIGLQVLEAAGGPVKIGAPEAAKPNEPEPKEPAEKPKKK